LRARRPRPGAQGGRRALIIGDGDVAQLRKPAPRLTRARDGLRRLQRGLQRRAFRAGYQDAGGQLAFRYLDGPGPPERPSAQGDVLCRRPAGGRAQLPAGGLPAAFHLCPQRGPAAEAELTGDRELRCRQGGTVRYRAKPRQRPRLARRGGAEQLTGLAAKLVNVSALGKIGHDVSSEPRSAFRPAKKTKIVEDHE
jgi:hypothetical protein